MAFKEKLIGFILIILGFLPLLLKLEAVNNLIGKYELILPGNFIYQAIIIVLGIFLLIGKRARQNFAR